MKKTVIILLTLFSMSFLFCSCREKLEHHKINIDVHSVKKHYGKKLKITPLDEFVMISKDKIIFAPQKEDCEYTISGYFSGQIINTTKNTVIILDNVYLENKFNNSAFLGETKTEITVAKDSENYIVSTGRGYSSSAALRGKRGLVIGGSGKLYVKGCLYHGVEAEDIKIKGSGMYYFQGTRKGSAINCDTLAVESNKNFSAYCINSKNGIKADRTINISSGNFYLYNNYIGLKTDIYEESPEFAHAINLEGGKFYIFENEEFFVTDKDCYNNSGAEIIEESE